MGGPQGLDVGLNLELILPQVPEGQRKVFFLAATCETCNKGFIKVFQEDGDYLESLLPFVCQHGVGSVVRIDLDSKAGDDELYAPGSGFAIKPLIPGEPNTTIRMINPAMSTVASSVDMAKLKVRGKELENKLEQLTRAKKVLRQAVPIRRCYH